MRASTGRLSNHCAEAVTACVTWAELDPGLDDDGVFQLANELSALLLTADKDFGEIVFRQQRVTNGVVLIRVSGLTLETKARLVTAIVHERESDLLGNFTVIAPGIVRTRRPVP